MWWWLWGRRLKDKFGIGWRNDYASSLLPNLHKLDILELIIDDYLHSNNSELQQVYFLESQIELSFHGISLGLASSFKLDSDILNLYSKFLKGFKNPVWSEHLAFVRAENIEIFHLAQPPLNMDTIQGLIRNLELVYKKIGSYPILENVASLVLTPFSNLSEKEFLLTILEKTNIFLLLDLHNLYANSINFNYDPFELLESLPVNRVKAIHLAGGKKVGKNLNKILDTHQHPIPEEVFQLLEYFIKRNPPPLQIILERDGNYPPINDLLEEIKIAKSYVNKGRRN